jgi:hypothetical protein
MRLFARPLFWGLFFSLASSGCGSCKAHGAAPDAAPDARVAHVDASDAPPQHTRAVPEAGPADDSLPPSTSDELTTRAKHLLEAIQKDDGDLAADLVFPRDAYLTVKDVADPGKHWDAKVLAAFRAQIHKLHLHTKGVDHAAFVSFEVGQPVVQALPKKKDLKRTLWRAHRSRLHFTVDGKALHIEVAEMTGWQGSWYVTHLKAAAP